MPNEVAISCHIPASRSPVTRDGSIIAAMNREYVATITNTGKLANAPVWSPNVLTGEHQIALHLLTRKMHQPIRRIRRRVFGPDPCHVLR